MARLEWDKTGEKMYETGVDRGVLYPMDASAYTTGVAWNGLTAVNEKPSGGESNDIYADNVKYLDLQSAEKFGATIEAYMYPKEFAACDGSAELTPGVTISGQKRKMFGLSYRTMLGNDTQNEDYGYRIHLVYGCKAAPSEKGYNTVSDNPDAVKMTWEINTTPVAVTGFKPTSHIVITCTKENQAQVKKLEDILYGASAAPKLPLPDEVKTTIASK